MGPKLGPMNSAEIFEPARVWLKRGALDRRIARGADPSASPELDRRARQLTSRRTRAGLAAGIRRVVEEAEFPQRSYSAAVPVHRREVLRERGFLVAIAEDLLSDDELSPRGIALVDELLRDGNSPIYSPAYEGALHAQLTHARAALHLG
jgi:hypothetical protein